jgi:hypothetical protein
MRMKRIAGKNHTYNSHDDEKVILAESFDDIYPHIEPD